MNNKLEAAKNAVTSRAGINMLKLKKNSPTLMFGLGVAGVVATAVLTARATLKLEPILDDHNSSNEILKAAHDADPNRSDTELKKDLTVNTAKTVFAVGRLYALPVVVGTASIGLLTGSHVTLKRRNTATTAAYIALAQGFEEYRDRVRQDVGEEKELEYRHGVVTREYLSEGKKGEPIVTQQKAPERASIYARFFTESNPDWNPTPDYNLITLRSKQNWANTKLQSDGYIFLNDVYKELNLPPTPAGQIMGWIKDAHERGVGDGYVDFGVWNDDNMMEFVAYLNGHSDSILLDFNVDAGPIYNLI